MEKIELVKPNFVVGDEDRFLNYIKNLKGEKLAIVSHTDLDGIASAKVANEILKADLIKFVDYSELNEKLVEYLRKEDIKKLVILDLAFDQVDFIKAAEKYFEILCIDHHIFSQDYNSEKITYLNCGKEINFCATYLTYYLFSKIKDISYYDWLVACASLADYTIFTNVPWMEKVYKKYGDIFYERFFEEDGTKFNSLTNELMLGIVYFKSEGNYRLNEVLDKIQPSFGNIGDLGKYSSEVKKEVDENFSLFEKEKKEVNGRIFFSFRSKFRVNSQLINRIGTSYPGKTILVVRIENNNCFLSLRRSDKREDMNALAKKLVVGMENSTGGGHIAAAGGNIMLRDLPILKKRFEET